jgi:tetratricopeptide (TPR) repeat protein
VYQRQGKFEEAAQALRESYDLLVALGDERGQAMVLNSLGGVYQRQGKFEEAAQTLQQSRDLWTILGDKIGLAMVLNSLGGVYQRQGKFEEAAQALRESQAISEELKDQRSLAMVLNSLGGVYQRQGKFEEAVEAFQRSFALGKEADTHRTMVLTSWGKALLDHGQPEEAVEKLKASFEIEERLRKVQGLRMVMSSLVRALTIMGQTEEAQLYCRRALTIAPDDKRLLKIQQQLSEPHQVSSQTLPKVGQIKRVIRNLAGYLYGFIIPDDGSEDIYFGESQVDAPLLSQLAEGLYVNVEVERTARGPRARRVWQNGSNQVLEPKL